MLTEKAKFNIEAMNLKTSSLIERQFTNSNQLVNISGSDSSPSLSILLSSNNPEIHKRPHLIIVNDEKTARSLISDINFFDPSIEVAFLPSFDVGVYSGLYPHSRISHQRLNWYFEASQAKPGQIFIATVMGICQKSIPYLDFIDSIYNFKIGDELPDDISNKLNSMGYSSVSVVEDFGTYSIRGGIVDIFSPAHTQPIRIELFGNTIESLRTFNPQTQTSTSHISEVTIIPCKETLYSDTNRLKIAKLFKESTTDRNTNPGETDYILNCISKGIYFNGVEFLSSYFYDSLSQPIDYFSTAVNIWNYNPIEIDNFHDNTFETLKEEFSNSDLNTIRNDYKNIFINKNEINYSKSSFKINYSKVNFKTNEETKDLEWRTQDNKDLNLHFTAEGTSPDKLAKKINDKFIEIKESGFSIFISCTSSQMQQRLKFIFENSDFNLKICNQNDYLWDTWINEQSADKKLIHLVQNNLTKSTKVIRENIIILKDTDFYKKTIRNKKSTDSSIFNKKVGALSFAELNEKDLIVHKKHGLGVYLGLKKMLINGAESEFLLLEYKGKDKLYLPIYRIGQIQKFSGPQNKNLLDKLGGQSFEKTKSKVKKHLEDIANELLRLYAIRAKSKRPKFSDPDEEFTSFEKAFPYNETDDQLNTIDQVIKDMTSDKPMDRLICGDVGFGKTEVAMRAAFKCVQDKKQVAVIAPTTILTLQHFENFKKRFKDWPIKIECLNRFIPGSQVKKNIKGLENGEVDIIIGTHRLFSKDVSFKNLGLLVIDEEQKFGVKHKEKIRKIKNDVDTLCLSATPIPRTLNMSLVGLRDMSLINTAPVDRLPTRTFVCRRENTLIRKSILNEIERGGQIFYLHNKVLDIDTVANELRELVPEARIKYAHGQMKEDLLENIMLEFFNHEIDILLCTTIIESGIDIPNANTIFINDAQNFGLSQLYQLRGRVGRSKRRAYCYLLIPPTKKLDKDAQERLRVIQENSALGSGIRIAQHDLELRGSGNILGQNQSGHINSVGYELYMELLDETIKEQKGEEISDYSLEPEINLRVPAFIPDNYIKDIKIRLTYYKRLSDIDSADDLDQIEDELKDQFGKIPEQVINLMGVMLIRKTCKDLGIKDVSVGKIGISLSFTEKTLLPANKVVDLSMKENKKYAIQPNNRLSIRMKDPNWNNVYDELLYLKKLCPDI